MRRLQWFFAVAIVSVPACSSDSSGPPLGKDAGGTFSQVQSIGSSQFEAVDLSPIMNRTGFDPNSAAVPSP